MRRGFFAVCTSMMTACGLGVVGTAPGDNPSGSGGTTDAAHVGTDGHAPGAEADGSSPPGVDVDAGADVDAPTNTISVTREEVPTALDLDTEGKLGWIHWGRNGTSSIDQKSSATGVIPTYVLSNSDDLNTYANNKTSFRWENGTPTANESGTTTGVYSRKRTDQGSTFTVTRKAGATTPLRMVVYAGVSNAKGTMTATLGTVSSSAELDHPGDNDYGRFVIDFQATDPSITLTVAYVLTSAYDSYNSNITFAAATLAPR